jgi:hypothetical protein
MPHDHHAISARASKNGGRAPGVHAYFLRPLLALSIAGLAFGFARNAAADATFPPILKSHWGISSFPGATADGCTLCHQTDAGGNGTATRPFGKTMKALRVIGTSPDTLPPALDYDRSHVIDSDGDGVGDYQELVVDHTNPNDPKSYVKPPPKMMTTTPDGEGGQGGDTGTTVTGNDGGQPSVVEPPPFDLPPLGDLPPPYQHGCVVTAGSKRAGSSGILALALALTTATARRRRRAPRSSDRSSPSR